jgi:4-aminobutyrate--pyruvate transaminase
MSMSDASDPLRLLMGFQPLSHGTRDRTLVVHRGKGVFVYDESGKEYLEAASSFYVASLGYSEEELIETATEQLRTLPYYPSAQYRAVPTALELAERLAERMPLAHARVAFSATGSEANDFLLKFLRFRNVMAGDEKRTKVIARHGSYHGATLASASLTGGHHQEFGLPLPGFVHTLQPERSLRGAGESGEAFAARLADELEALILREDPETVAAFLTEPVSFACGLIVPPETYWDRVQAVLAKYDILCFLDEVVTGFGRTGNWWGSQTYGIRPDCITIGKGMSSGYYPISAIAMSGEFFAELERGSEKLEGFAHAATHAGHPVATAVALKVLEIIERRNLVENARAMGTLLREKLSRYAEHPLVVDVRGVGLAAAVEFHQNDEKAAAMAPSSVACAIFCERARERGLLVRGTGASVIMAPPLVISRAEIEELCDRFDAAFRDTEERLPVP